MVGIERSKDPELPLKQQNTSWFVILDDRKHGRSGKFAVFYDIDTGDYLEPPEGFLDSPYETLREWYSVHPEDDPNSDQYRGENNMRDSSQPLSEENAARGFPDLTEDDIPKDDVGSNESQSAPQGNSPVDGEDGEDTTTEGKEDVDGWDEVPF